MIIEMSSMRLVFGRCVLDIIKGGTYRGWECMSPNWDLATRTLLYVKNVHPS